jgi:aspartyl-tRNA(Asn)/glutamyl-tRNA(Gln) amidotransferase subunit A
MHTKTIAQLAKGLHAGDFSSVELTQAYLARILQNQSLNSFISITDAQALASTAAAEPPDEPPGTVFSAQGFCTLP